ncbi:unnamed protein product [Ilex paraguariensis]|uniref:Uncharacterized protein n=1 Tax=Ilex paraguariensis TaxID=185542 RepID=A0ABC8RPH5_9AQUA
MGISWLRRFMDDVVKWDQKGVFLHKYREAGFCILLEMEVSTYGVFLRITKSMNNERRLGLIIPKGVNAKGWIEYGRLLDVSRGKLGGMNGRISIMISSWQIPMEVTELKKRQNADALKEQVMSVPNTNQLTEKGSAPISLSAPAVNTGGRDATALRATDSGSPAAASPVPALPGAVASELNGSRAIESSVKGSQSENSNDKPNDANGDCNLSDSSSDSEDVESGPTKEECTIQFKVSLVLGSLKFF